MKQQTKKTLSALLLCALLCAALAKRRTARGKFFLLRSAYDRPRGKRRIDFRVHRNLYRKRRA